MANLCCYDFILADSFEMSRNAESLSRNTKPICRRFLLFGVPAIKIKRQHSTASQGSKNIYLTFYNYMYYILTEFVSINNAVS